MKKSFVGSIAAGIIAAALLPLVVSADIALFAGFIIALALIIYSDRKKVKLDGIVIMRRTQRGKSFIDKVANSHPVFWRRLSNFGVVLGIILMVFGALFLIVQTGAVLSGAQDGGVKLLLPGPVSTPVNAPGVFVVPWWIWIIGIAVVIIPHEFMHGIMCRIDKVRIKSVGWLLLFIIPGAFVEPDEKQLKKASKMTRLRVDAAGSFANMIMAGVIFLVAFVAVFAMSASSTISPNGVLVSNLPGGAAENASLNGTIIALGGTAIVNQTSLTNALSGYSPGDTVEVVTSDTYSVLGFFPNSVTSDSLNYYNITLASRDGGAFLGVKPVDHSFSLKGNTAAYAIISLLLYWMFLFSFGIGLVNLLPIKPLDGGLILEELVGNKKIVYAVSLIFAGLLIFNIIGPLFL